tara:strand:+ start:2258 stop:3061 length:804 start_codon:yes stop_codon:yes gene_type:complete
MKVAKTESEIKHLWGGYLKFVKDFFQDTHTDMVINNNHLEQDRNTHYIENMVLPISQYPLYWKDKVALDFGCGCGRNIRNLLTAADFARVDGCDVSKRNAEYTKKYIEKYFNLEKDQKKCNTWETNGYDLQPAQSEEYDYVMSHIVFQHIPNYSIRYNILKDIHRVLKKGGIANIHFMDLNDSVAYYDEYPTDVSEVVLAEETGKKVKSGLITFDEHNLHLFNCRVEDESFLVKDFTEIGFINIGCVKTIDPYSNKQDYYMFARKKL